MSELERGLCARASRSPLDPGPPLAGIAACALAVLLTHGPLIHCGDTHKSFYFSVDFQIFSRVTVSDVFQILRITLTHLGRDRADESSLSISISKTGPAKMNFPIASILRNFTSARNLIPFQKELSRPCTRRHFGKTQF